MFCHKNKMILNNIKKLQQKPVIVRKRISFLISFSVTFLILMIWLSVFSLNSDEKTITEENKSIDNKLNVATPFVKIKNDLNDIFKNIPEGFNNLKNKIDSNSSTENLNGDSVKSSTSTGSNNNIIENSVPGDLDIK